MILGKPSKMHICFHHLMTMKWIETANKPTIHSIHSTPGHKPTTCRRPVIQLRSLWRVQLKLEQRWGYGISMEGRMTMAHSLIPIYIRPRPLTLSWWFYLGFKSIGRVHNLRNTPIHQCPVVPFKNHTNLQAINFGGLSNSETWPGGGHASRTAAKGANFRFFGEIFPQKRVHSTTVDGRNPASTTWDGAKTL